MDDGAHCMKRVLLLIKICIIAFACKAAKEDLQPDKIKGSWYFIDEAFDHDFIYNEVHIDSSKLVMFLGKGTFVFEYRIKLDTLHLITYHNSWPIWAIKEAKTDTLVVDLLDRGDDSRRPLEIIRLPKDEKGPFDYSPVQSQDIDSISQINENNYARRVNAYYQKAGLIELDDELKE
jgi:hypothetical protein